MSRLSVISIFVKKSLVVFFSVSLLVIILRFFLFDIFGIPTNSMSPTIEDGDFVIVSKIEYGPRVVRVLKFYQDNRIDFHWYEGICAPQQGDIFVFNWPDYNSLSESNPDFYGDFIVKRCAAVGGDTVIINDRMKNEKMKVIKKEEYYFAEKPLLFPYDSTLNWTVDHYGPLWVPGKGKTMKLSAVNANHYKGMLLFEGNTIDIKNDSVFLNHIYRSEYTFKENYYFMRGDNFYGSADSRFWGFVPQKSIVGKAVLVLFSLDPDAKWYRKFRWSRLLKRIK